MWQGCLLNEDGRKVQAWFDAGHCLAVHIHNSGHASALDLRRFASKINPKMLIPALVQRAEAGHIPLAFGGSEPGC